LDYNSEEKLPFSNSTLGIYLRLNRIYIKSSSVDSGMLHIDEYIRSHRKEIIDSIEGSYIPIETTTGQIFN
jgi:hypothetical protein